MRRRLNTLRRTVLSRFNKKRRSRFPKKPLHKWKDYWIVPLVPYSGKPNKRLIIMVRFDTEILEWVLTPEAHDMIDREKAFAQEPSCCVGRCVVASSRPPQKWPASVLAPINKSGASIFGDAHTYYAEDRIPTLVQALVDCNLAPSNSAATRAIKNQGVKINGVRCSDPKRQLVKEDILANIDAIVIENGKFNYGIVDVLTEDYKPPLEKLLDTITPPEQKPKSLV